MSDIRRRRSASEIGSFHIILFIGNLKRGIYQPKKWFQNWNSLHRENLPNGETFQLWRLDQEQSDEKIISAMLRAIAGWLQFMSTCAHLEAVREVPQPKNHS